MDIEHLQDAADRLSAKLEALDLDDDERAVLLSALGASAQSSSVTASDEVEGFTFMPTGPMEGIGGRPGVAGQNPASDTPMESLSLNFTKVEFTYSVQS